VVAAAAAGAALPAAAPAARNARGSSASASYTFVSAPNLHPPKPQVLRRTGALAAGDFLAATAPPRRVGPLSGQGGPVILDDRLQPVWFLPVSGPPFGLQQETYRGKPVLVWFQGGMAPVAPGGKPPPSYRRDRWVIYDEHYRKIATVRAQSPWMTDLHDAWITGEDIWIVVHRVVHNENLTRYGGSQSASVDDFGLQEFQISSGRLVRTWDALNPGGKPNVPLSESKTHAGSGWDAYHLNSVQALPNGNLLLSMRNTWAVYLIDPATDRTIWTLGGKASNFTLGPGASFAWQHDARLMHPAQEGLGRDVELTLFNDDNGARGAKPSRGMILSLDTSTHRATLVSSYRHDPPLAAQVLGSMQVLPNGNALVGWGSEPYFSEYSGSGEELLDVRWPGAIVSYRTLFTDTWVGRPDHAPRGAARGRIVYASWNGATEVASWQVLAGSRAGDLKAVATRQRSGFETAIKLRRSYGVYEVRALSSAGRALGTSKPFS
jgi:Arylsulfotransferase (ASST)